MREELQTLEEIKTIGLTRYPRDLLGIDHTMRNYLWSESPERLFEKIKGAAEFGTYFHFLGFDKASYPAYGWLGTRTMAMIFEDLDDYSKIWFHITTNSIGYFWKQCGLSDDEIRLKFVNDYGFSVDDRFRCAEEAESEDEILKKAREKF